MDDLLASHFTDLQQRAYELQVFLELSPNIVQKVLPVNGSGEEIEVCAFFTSKELHQLLKR
jgi:AP-4 complex subunit epsilon-1